MNSIRNLFLSLLPLSLLLLLLPSCDRMVYDKLDYCERGVYINVYEQTECEQTPSYPELQNLRIFGFDNDGVLVGDMTVQNPQMGADKTQYFPVSQAGSYSFVVWANVSDKLTESAFQIGQTRKSDLLYTLRTQAGKAVDLGTDAIYVGSTPNVIVGDEDNFFVQTAANIREITNRITVEVVGLEAAEEGLGKPENYEIQMMSNNTLYAYPGEIIPAAQAVYYPGETTYSPNPDKEGKVNAHAFFSTLKLEMGRANHLVVRNKVDGTEIFREDLIGAILLSDKEANINPRCINDFDVRVEFKLCHCPSVYSAVAIYINNWLVHSYDIEL